MIRLFGKFLTSCQRLKMVIVQCILFLVAIRSWCLIQLDAINAFLRVDLTKEVYMSLPIGFGSKGVGFSGMQIREIIVWLKRNLQTMIFKVIFISS